MAESTTRAAAFDRETVERSLDDLVTRYRFEIAVVFPVVGAIALVGGALGYVPRALAFAPLFVLAGTLVMRLPLVAGLAPLVDRRAALSLAGICAYAYGIEYVGTTTGWPYGEFSYGVELGPMVAGVPLALPLFFLPLVCNAALLVACLLGDRPGWVRVPATVAVVLVVDLVLDPGAVALGFWAYADGGAYYGVPLSNYLGWLLSGTVGVLAFDAAFDHRAVLARLDERAFLLDDLVSFVLLWGVVNLAFANWIPVALTVGLVAGLLYTDRFDVATGSLDALVR